MPHQLCGPPAVTEPTAQPVLDKTDIWLEEALRQHGFIMSAPMKVPAG